MKGLVKTMGSAFSVARASMAVIGSARLWVPGGSVHKRLPMAPVVIARKRAEVAQARPGENAPQAIITCIETAMRLSSYANGVMVEQRAGCHRQDLCSQRGAEVQVSKWCASVRLHKCADRYRTVSLSKLKLSLVGHTWSSILSLLSKLRCACQLPLWSPQFGRV